MASPHSKAYKYEKRMIEEIFKGKRIIDQSGGSPDGFSPWLAIEIFQKDIPQYLKDELYQAVRGAGNKLPIAVWREKHKKDEDALVFMRLRDFRDWFLD